MTQTLDTQSTKQETMARQPSLADMAARGQLLRTRSARLGKSASRTSRLKPPAGLGHPLRYGPPYSRTHLGPVYNDWAFADQTLFVQSESLRGLQQCQIR